MPDLLGAVLRRARILSGVTQVQVAERLRMPQAAISKLENGQMTMSVYHLDLIADILTEHLGGDEPEAQHHVWAGWQLHAITAHISEQLEGRDYIVVWEPARSIENPDLYTRGKRLYRRVCRLWPEEFTA